MIVVCIDILYELIYDNPSIDTVKTDTCKHACYADDNWLQLISILEQSGQHTSPKDAVLSQWSNPKKGCFSQLMYAP